MSPSWPPGWFNHLAATKEIALKKIFGILLFVSSLDSIAQSTIGLTGVADTTFTNAAAFLKVRKSFPNSKLPSSDPVDGVTEYRGITYGIVKGRSLELDVFSPEINSNRTAILIIHGGGWRSGNRHQHDALARQLATRGFTCFSASYRLSTEALYPAAILDLKQAVRYIRAHAANWNLNNPKLAALGFSAGGQLAAFLGATSRQETVADTTDAVDAVVDIDGILSFIHPESGEGNDSVSTSAATYWLGYGKKENPGLWEEASPLTYAGPHCPPFLFLNSGVARMHAGRDDFIRVLSANGIYSEVHSLAGAPHTFCLFEPWFGPTVDYIDAFLKQVFHLTVEHAE